MLKMAWAKAVYKLRISAGKRHSLYTSSTAWLLNVLHGTFFVPILGAAFTRRIGFFTHLDLDDSNLVDGWFYSFSTVPNEATN